MNKFWTVWNIYKSHIVIYLFLFTNMHIHEKRFTFQMNRWTHQKTARLKTYKNLLNWNGNWSDVNLMTLFSKNKWKKKCEKYYNDRMQDAEILSDNHQELKYEILKTILRLLFTLITIFIHLFKAYLKNTDFWYLQVRDNNSYMLAP